MQEEEPEEQTTPRPDRTESPLGEGAEEFLAAELSEVAQRAGDYPEVEVGASPLPIPDVPEPTEEINPGPVFRGEPGSPIDEVSVAPLPLPDPGGEVSDTPIPMDEVSSLPLPLPDPGLEDGLGDVGDIPIPLPNEADLSHENDLTAMDEELFEEPLE